MKQNNLALEVLTEFYGTHQAQLIINALNENHENLISRANRPTRTRH
jgi:hypothetical protein